MPASIFGETFDPADRLHHDKDLVKAGQDAQYKDTMNDPIELGVGLVNRRDLFEPQIEARPDQPEHNQHEQKFANGL